MVTGIFELLKISVNLTLRDMELFGQLSHRRSANEPAKHDADTRNLAIAFGFPSLAMTHGKSSAIGRNL